MEESILEGSNELEDYQRISVLPEIEHQEEIDMSDGPSISETYDSFDPGTPCQCIENQQHDQYDLGQDLSIARKKHWKWTIVIKWNDWWWLQVNDTKYQWKTNDITPFIISKRVILPYIHSLQVEQV